MQIDKTVRKRAIPYSDPDGYMKVKAQMGNSSTWKADREQPAGERRLREPCEYLPELCIETSGSDFSENSRLQRFGIR